ncbi:hypothetical protein FJY93_01790 [Candidatus Kaiserbacteria bacterium]|nr:hypothetical protein [Candidatus Kaiserbacteria bacterium]
MQHIKLELARKIERDRRTERGELMKYFRERLNPGRRQEGLPAITMSRMGKLLEGIPTKDLYYLKSVCDKARNFSTKFWYELNPEKYTEAAKGKPAKYEKRPPGADGRFL